MDLKTWRILTEREECYDEYGFADINGEYDEDGFPLPVTFKQLPSMTVVGE